MSFHFVDNSAANNPGARKAIRRHVMKGKNLGRRIEGRGKKHARRDSREELVAKSEVVKFRECPERRYLLFPEVRVNPLRSAVFAGHEFEYFSFPTQFTPEMRYLVYQYNTAIFETIYPYSFCRPSMTTHAPWLEYMITDQAFLHCLLGMAATYHELFEKPGRETVEAIQHFSQAFHLVNNKLSQDPIPSDSTLAVIITFAIHGVLMHDMTQSRVHIDGLEGILALRPGGLSSLRESNRDLMHKICRADAEVALQAGTQTRFGQLGVAKSNLLGRPGRVGFPLNQASVPLRAIAQEIMSFCKLPEKTRISGFDYQDLITWMWQRLVDFAPLGAKRPENPLDDVLHLGLQAFLATVTFAVTFLRERNTILVREMLRDRVERDPLSSLGRDYLPLRFWLAFMLGLISTGSSDYPASRLKSLAKELSINTWGEARSCLRSLPWMSVVHEESGKRFWEKMFRD